MRGQEFCGASAGLKALGETQAFLAASAGALPRKEWVGRWAEARAWEAAGVRIG